MDNAVVIFDSAWPCINVKSLDEAFLVGNDQNAYDDGIITADEFIEMWGVSPDGEYLISYKF